VVRSIIQVAVLASTSLFAIGCDTPETCTSWSGGSGPEMSTATFSECRDGRKREVSCTGAPNVSVCNCILNGTIARTFKRTEMFPQTFEIAQAEANAACGWKLRR
jgi:hypothetical protein